MNQKARLAFVAALLVCITCVVISSLLISASANKSEAAPRKTYESIVIRPNDTLWGYAEVYAEELGLTGREYIDEVKQINGLNSDRIISGTHLIIVKAK